MANIEQLFIPGQEEQCRDCRYRTDKPIPYFGYKCRLVTLDGLMLIFPRATNNICNKYALNLLAVLKRAVILASPVANSLGLSLPH